jgi:DNA-directed RNA polymerase specialized sigma24 family protein
MSGKVRVRRVSENVRVSIDMDITGDSSSDPLTVINGITAGVKGMEPPLRAAVKLARQQGRTWEEIGKALGVSRQSAWERFSGG